MRSYQAHETFRLMRVELIHDEDPTCRFIGLDGLLDVMGKIGFGAPLPNRGSDHLSGGNLKVANQTLGAVSDILILLAFNQTRFGPFRGMLSLFGLNASHLITTDQMDALFVKLGSLMIEVTHTEGLLIKFLLIERIGILPGSTTMRFQINFVLKNDPHFAWRSF